MEQHTYLVIDLKSFYASVECIFISFVLGTYQIGQ